MVERGKDEKGSALPVIPPSPLKKGCCVHISPSICQCRDISPPNPPILGGYEILRFPQNWGLGGGSPATLLIQLLVCTQQP